MIINGNCIEEMAKLEPESIDLIFADPPYWMRVNGTMQRSDGSIFSGCYDKWDQFTGPAEYKAFTEEWLRACYRVLKPDGAIWVIGSMQCIYTIGAIMQEIGFWFINDVIWQKSNPTPNFLGTRLNNSHETLIWAAKSSKSKFTFNYKTAKEMNRDSETGICKQMGSVWKMPICSGSERLKDSAGEKLHNTQKPVELLKRLIAFSSRPGDTILDPFAGTMTTAAAAKELGRKYIMIEREKKYCDYGSERLAAVNFIPSPIASAELDKKPLKVSMQEMIAQGYFIPGEKFYLKTGDAAAILQQTGKLEYNGQVSDMHSCAARISGSRAKRLNGFDYWQVIRDGKRVAISDIREQYRKTKE